MLPTLIMNRRALNTDLALQAILFSNKQLTFDLLPMIRTVIDYRKQQSLKDQF